MTQSFLMQELLSLLVSVPGLLLCLSLHEAAHGYTAYRLGDPTAKNAGRLTLDPLKHLDPVGTICLLFFHVGWAKPVPVNTRYFKNPRRDTALVSLAGPVSNFLLAAVLLFIRQFLIFSSVMPVYVLGLMVHYAAIMSIGLGVFNLIPVPPLDGSKILFSFLPWQQAAKYAKYEQYIQFGLLVLLFVGVLDVPLDFCISHIYSWLSALVTVI
ncbi:MAG: site-2 protease family protein [Butyricicoccus sp.]|jgi:Zn-dependent protease|nr:site-2 protease family protein [Clostridiales bacterium]